MKYKINSSGDIILADRDFVEAHYPGDFAAVIEAPETPAQPLRRVSGLAFKSRMTPAERKRIRAAAKVNSDIEDFMDLANSAEYIDLDREDARGGMLAMEAAGLLDSLGRALEILDGPIADSERYRG